MLDFAPAETFFSPFEIRLEGGEKITAFLEEIDDEYKTAYARL